MSTGGEREFVRSLARGLAVMAAFSEERPEMTISAVAARADLTRATARRILHTLCDLGFVAVEGDRFRLTAKALTLGFSYLSSLALPEIAHPHIERMVTEVHESSSLAVLEWPDIVYVARVPTRRMMSVTLTVGARLPAFATSMGRVLLAETPCPDLDRLLASEAEFPALTARTVRTAAELKAVLDGVRAQGYALTDQELEEGVRSIAVAVRDGRRRAVAALNIAAHAGRVSTETMVEEFLPRLRAAAAAIEADVRHRPPISRIV